MRRPDASAPATRRPGTGADDASPCYCRGGATCITCLRWSRRIHAIEQRRAMSLRRQALGGLLRPGAV